MLFPFILDGSFLKEKNFIGTIESNIFEDLELLDYIYRVFAFLACNEFIFILYNVASEY